jgi:hypothetical protein
MSVPSCAGNGSGEVAWACSDPVVGLRVGDRSRRDHALSRASELTGTAGYDGASSRLEKGEWPSCVAPRYSSRPSAPCRSAP